MTEDELKNYLLNNNYSKKELIKILNDYKIPYKKYYSRKQLIFLIANEIHSIGVFKRIAEIK